MLGGLGDLGDHLDAGRAGTDHPDHLVAKLVERRRRAAAGIVEIPAAGVEALALEAFDAGDAGQLGGAEQAGGGDDEARRDTVAAVGMDDPAVALLVPDELLDHRLEHAGTIEVVALRQSLHIGEDLGALGVFLGRDVVHLFEQRHVDIGFDVAGNTGIAVPVPGAAEVGALLDDADVLDSGLAQPAAGEQRGEAAADHQHVGVLDDRIAGEIGVGVRVLVEIGEGAREMPILVDRVVAQPLGALLGIFPVQRVDVDLDVGGVGRVSAHWGLPLVHSLVAAGPGSNKARVGRAEASVGRNDHDFAATRPRSGT